MSNERLITVYSTKGKQKLEVTTDATVWSELKALISNEYTLSNLQATENVGRKDLVHKDAVLPEGPFSVFLRPKKTKSGAGTYFETRAAIKLAIEKHPESAVAHFNEGKNYTNKSKAALEELLASWNPKGCVTPAKKAAPKKKVVAKKKVVKVEAVETVEVATTEDKSDAEVLAEMQAVINDINARGDFEVEFSYEEINDTALEEEANALMSGFED